jgi:hypothetical protein
VIRKQVKGIPQLVEHGIASHFLALVFGWDWHQRHVAFQPVPDDWMLNGNDAWREGRPDGDVLRITYEHRVVRLADGIFTLVKGGVDSFDLLKQRFFRRSTKPCFIEAEIASLLAFNGFQVEFLKESGVLGEDFDVLATKDGVQLSVEITGKDDQALAAKTMTNTLKAKRKQVRPDRPAVFYIHVPAEWMTNIEEAKVVLNEAIVPFFTSSRRINAIVFVWERVIPHLQGGFPQINLLPCFNNKPRFPYDRLDLLGLTTDAQGEPKMCFSLLEWLESIERKRQEKKGTE